MASPKPRKNQELTRHFPCIGERLERSDVPQVVLTKTGVQQRFRCTTRHAGWRPLQRTDAPASRRRVVVMRDVPDFGHNEILVQTLCRAGYVGHASIPGQTIASAGSDTAASFNKNAEPVNTDSSHRSYQRAIILKTSLVLASLCRQDGETTGQVKKGSAT
jgi:hypothetical protein